MASASMLVGEWFAGKVLDKLASVFCSHFSGHYDLIIGVEEKLKEVKDQLPAIQAVIQAAEGRPIRDRELLDWLRQLKDAAFKADDILDEFDYKQIQDMHLKDSSQVSAFATSARRFLKNLIVSGDELKRLKSLLGDLDKINQGFNQKKDQLNEYNSKQKNPSREIDSSNRDVVIGRDRERDVILRILLNDTDEPDFGDKGAGSSSHTNLCVLPIVGIGGVGKTALARLIYSDKTVASRFEIIKWVFVSQDFNLKRISRELETNVTAESRPIDLGLETLLGKLSDSTRNKRFLFVLDDVWDETGSKWTVLRSALSYGARGSTVIITTQSPLVAKVMGAIDAIVLDVLEEDAYLRLFEHCSFGEEEIDMDLRRKLQLIGQKISKKLHGLPLAAKALGSLLKSRLDETFWKAIQESEWWEHDALLDKILPSLGLSYQHLSPNLKQCFAYTSLFPRGHIFDKERLVQLWIAQGFTETSQLGMRKEDAGSQIFDELADKYFFLNTVNNGYMMHDLIRELAVFVSLDDCFILDDGVTEIPPNIRHLTFRTTTFNVLTNALKMPKLRTLVFYSEFPSSEGNSLEEFYEFLQEHLKNQTSLRVIDLSCSRTGIKKLPDAICELSHLRYLDISYTKIRQLPKSFAKLYHLQVLNLRWCRFKKLPEGMNKLIRLRHLYANADTISLIDGIGKLTELQELEEFSVSKKRGHQITELKELRELRRRLAIKNIENVKSKEEAMEAKLEEKEHLSKLLLHRQTDIRSQVDTDKDIFDGLHPHCNLEELKIEHYGGRNCPSWLENNIHFICLKFVLLHNCPRLESLPPFGQLPYLKNLHLKMMPLVRKIGVEFYGHLETVFPSLEVLELIGFTGLENWDDPVGEPICPSLRHIIFDCHNMSRMPVLSSIPVECFGFLSCGPIGNSLCNSLLQWTSLIKLDMYNYLQRNSVCLYNLTNLQHLLLHNCPGLTLIGGFQSLVNMKLLHIVACLRLIERPRSPQREQAYVEEDLRSLTDLFIDDHILNDVWFALGRTPSLSNINFHQFNHAYFSAEQEQWFLQLGSLQELMFEYCQNLRRFPAGLQLISSVKKLIVRRCSNIQSMPENGLPESLQALEIWDCPILIERCKKDEGPDWPLISNIREIMFNGEIIQIL